MKTLQKVVLIGAFVLAAASSQAASVFVTVNTSNLVFGTYALQFQLTNGNAAAANSVSLDSFGFGGGSAGGGGSVCGRCTLERMNGA